MNSVSVVVAAYTMNRWALLTECIDSLLAQDLPPREIVLCIDNNDDLLTRARQEWGQQLVVLANPDTEHLMGASAHEKAHGSRRRFGAGSARNAGVAATSSDIVAIIDDDARAEPNWLDELVRPYADDRVVAVGGRPLPTYQTRRPDWFPASFDWVFGCAYRGLPTRAGPTRHLIGASMSFRRDAFDQVGGFHSIDFDDLDLCMRLGHTYGFGGVWWNPAAVVRHYVPADRVSWHYFWRRCLFVNVEKVAAFAEMDGAANLTAELGFALRTLTIEVARELTRTGRGGLRAAGAIVAGVGLAGLGNLWGRVRLRRAAAS